MNNTDFNNNEENNSSQNEYLDENFWKEVVVPKPKKRVTFFQHMCRFLLCGAIFLSGFAIAMITARGNGWLSNLVTGDKHTQFTLPTQDKPKIDDKLKESDGRYTAEGLAKTLSPTVTVIEVYDKNNKYLPSGQGSGVIISKNGYIVTNAHVVENGKYIKAVLDDGSVYNAKVVGKDIENDLAVIKIEATDLQPAEFGKSSQANLGEEVMTIGNPGGYEGTVTKGIISGLNRRIRLDTGFIDDCIQIDAAINPGNSGGALFNMWGQVIGITSSKLASENYDGIGFAISSDYAKPVVERLMSGKVEKPKAKIGISYYKIDKENAEKNNIEPGLMVGSIGKDYPVYKSGLKEGDIITEIDGKNVSEIKDLGKYIEKIGVGNTIKCKISRYKVDEKTGLNKKTGEKEIEIKIVKDNSIVEK